MYEYVQWMISTACFLYYVSSRRGFGLLTWCADMYDAGVCLELGLSRSEFRGVYGATCCLDDWQLLKPLRLWGGLEVSVHKLAQEKSWRQDQAQR